ncbi:MAG: hypothetical protein RI996_144 [Candidatus Parcubacteria bacterium]|jgi:cysteine desulfurase/selenocysteine lyase
MTQKEKRLENIREDFVIYTKYIQKTGMDLVYLDSASSSLTPNLVVEKMNEYYTEYRSNIERSNFGLSQRAKTECDRARVQIARLIGATPEEIIYTSGATDAANKIVDMICNTGSGKTLRILTSILEHHSILVTLLEKKQQLQYELDFFDIDSGGDIVLEQFKKKIEEYKPDYVCMQYASNVTGAIYDINTYADIAHTQGAKLICDGSQAVGHVSVDVKSSNIDVLFFSGHKMLGPTGIGVLYIEQRMLETLKPTVFGGNAVVSVSKGGVIFQEGVKRFEPGTQHISGIIGLGAAAEYILDIGIEQIVKHTQTIHTYAMSQLSSISRISLVSAPNNCGIISFYFQHIHTHDVEALLSERGIAVRSGYHCAERLVTEVIGKPLTRISIYVYTTQRDIDALVTELKRISALFN